MDKNLIKEVLKFREARDWKQFHSPENLAKSIAIEASELLECFQWSSDYDNDEVKEEYADIIIYMIYMADTLGIDINDVVTKKMETNGEKYPVNKSKGNSIKYNKR